MKISKLGYAAAVAVATVALVIGSAIPSEAKAKKKAAAAPAPTPIFCFGQYKPVCAVKGGMKFTYANACYAVKDGAKVSKPGECKPAKAKKAKKAMKKK